MQGICKLGQVRQHPEAMRLKKNRLILYKKQNQGWLFLQVRHPRLISNYQPRPRRLLHLPSMISKIWNRLWKVEVLSRMPLLFHRWEKQLWVKRDKILGGKKGHLLISLTDSKRHIGRLPEEAKGSSQDCRTNKFNLKEKKPSLYKASRVVSVKLKIATSWHLIIAMMSLPSSKTKTLTSSWRTRRRREIGNSWGTWSD